MRDVKPLAWSACIALALTLGCARGSGEHAHGATASSGRESMRNAPPGCARAASEQSQVGDVEGGVAVSYETSAADQVEHLRTRVAELAGKLSSDEPARGHGAMHAAMHKEKHIDVPVVASVEELPGGARLVLTPRDPADLQKLRAEARERPPHVMCSCPHHRAAHDGVQP